MGFRAPSAEDVYRYAMRLDEPDRSLTDRFGFSIIFVNDSSPVCTEFLRSYFVDLCHRTADRIRFIFFAELDEQEVAAAAEDLNRRGTRSGGLLNRLLRLSPSRSRFDSMFATYSSWEDLRPSSLHPAHPENTFERLGWKRDSHSSVPGLGVSLRFAQRMGIGRYVPCFVLFTDVGAHEIDVMPIRPEMSARDVYQHVRRWVDDYYEQNHETIEKWEGTEKAVQALRSELEATLRDIRRWGDLNRDLWDTLRICNRVIAEVQGLSVQPPSSWPDSLKTIGRSEGFPEAFKSVFEEFAKTVHRLANLQRTHEHVQTLSKRLQDANEFEAVFSALHGLKSAEALFRDGPVELDRCMEQMLEHRRRYRDSDPELVLFGWWSNVSRQLPSFVEYRTAVQNCASGSDEASKDGYRRFLALVRELPLLIEPAKAAADVTLALGQRLGSGNEQAWQSSLAPLQSKLEHYLREVASAPCWLTSALPSLPIGDAVPWKAGTPGKKVFDSFPADHFLRRLVSLERLEKSTTLAEIQDDNNGFAAECKSIVLASLHDVTAQFHVSDADWLTALSRFGSRLCELRASIEREVYDSADALLAASAPKKRSIDQATVKRLQEAMEAYRKAAASLRLPYKQDPFVQSVSIYVPMTDAANVHARSSSSVDDRLRADLERIANSESESDALWKQVRHTAHVSTPGLLLSQVIEAVFGEESPDVQREFVQGASATHGPRLNANVEELLAKLELAELDGLATELSRRIAKPKPAVNDKDVLIEFVLQELGADAARFRAKRNPSLAQPSYDFDVFLAHNSVDKAEVEAIALELKKAGMRVWLDKWELPPGRLFQDEIERVLPLTRAVAVLVGSGGLGPWERLEMRAAISQFVKRGAPVIPVLLPSASTETGLPLLLQEFSWVRFYSNLGVADPKAISSLVWGITGSAARTQVA